MYNRYAQKISWNVCLSECYSVLVRCYCVAILCCSMMVLVRSHLLPLEGRTQCYFLSIQSQLDMNTPCNGSVSSFIRHTFFHSVKVFVVVAFFPLQLQPFWTLYLSDLWENEINLRNATDSYRILLFSLWISRHNLCACNGYVCVVFFFFVVKKRISSSFKISHIIALINKKQRNLALKCNFLFFGTFHVIIE